MQISTSNQVSVLSNTTADHNDITKIADTRSDFTSIFNSAAINDSGTVVFVATSNSANRGGVYTSNGEALTEVIDNNQLPSLFNRQTTTPNNYSFDPLVDINNNGTVAFIANENNSPSAPDFRDTYKVIFVGKDGSFTTRGNGLNQFRYGGDSFTKLTLDDQDDLAYLKVTSNVTTAFIPEVLVLTKANQPDITIASAASTRPDIPLPPPEAPFLNIADVALNQEGKVTFAATRQSPRTAAIFTSFGGEPTNILEVNASALGANDQGDIVFSSGGTLQLLNHQTDTLRTIADTSGAFRSFSNLAINNNDDVAFTAQFGLGDKGIFTGADPVKDRVIATGDSLFGSTVTDVNFLSTGLNNSDQIVFYAKLADGTQGIFRADKAEGDSEKQPLPPPVEDAFPLNKVVDTLTPPPSGTDNFTSFNNLLINGDDVVFRGSTFGQTSNQAGIYKSSGGKLSTIADRNTPIPNGNGTFSDFVNPVVINGNNVVFTGNSINQQQGIYIKRGETPLDLIADKNTPIPGKTENFSGFSNGLLVLDENHVAFKGYDTNVQQGIYISQSGNLQLVADQNTPIPNGTGNFASFLDLAQEKNDLVFEGSSTSGQNGIYISQDGNLQLVADQNTLIPNSTGNFSGFSSLLGDANNLAFEGRGSSGQNGIYISQDGNLQEVVDNKTSIPGGTGNFSNFSNLALDQNNLAFKGEGNNSQQGIYISCNGALQVIADKNTTIPGSTRTFSSFSNPVVEGDIVAFVGSVDAGYGSIPVGIYANVGGYLFKVVDLTSRLDGQSISNISNLAAIATKSNSLAFNATFSDGTQAILRADLISDQQHSLVPEPAL